MNLPSLSACCKAMPLLIALSIGSAPASADDDDDDRPGARHCSATTERMYDACGAEAKDDLAVALARCINVADRRTRRECVAEARAGQHETRQLCRAQRAARADVCALLGEARYDPDFHPARFDSDFRMLGNPNPYFPLGIGYHWTYAGEGETTTVEILDERKDVEGVSCIVLRDLVYQDGELREATDDWFAAARDGGVWYCGEEVKDYETFEGDQPARPELVSIDGSFKHGRDGDKAGLIMALQPRPGQAWREEFSLGNAEDLAQVVSANYQYGADPALDHGVPAALAQRLCNHDCVVTRNFTPIEPGALAYKYYARGIGFFLEVKPDEGTALQLVGCNFDARCTGLAQP